MKRIALLPLAALMLLASCKDDETTPRPAVPTDPVATVESVADQVTLNLPEQDLDYEIVGNLYRFTYSNGQKITYQMSTDATLGYIAKVKKIEGATDVVIPPTVSVMGATSQQLVSYRVIALDLYQEGAPDVKKITISKSVIASIGESNAIGAINGDWFRRQMEMLPSLESMELETGFPGYCSINGAIYTSDYKTLVAVPRAKSGIFTIAENTENVADRAFYYCRNLTAITFPAAVKNIGSEAVCFNDMLVLVNMLPVETPVTAEDSFGLMAQTSVLRIPAGSKNSYFPAKPDVKEPVMPNEPDLDAPDEEWEQYDLDMVVYTKELAEYNEAMKEYNNPIGFRKFTNVEEVNF